MMRELNEVKAQFRKKIKYAVIATFVLSFYFAGVFNTAIKTFSVGAAFNPIAHIKTSLQYGLPVAWYLVCLFMFGCLFAYMLLKEAKEMEGMDVMGRLFRQTTKRQSYGDSHFETPDEYENLASIQTPDKAYGTILGQLSDDGTKVLNTRMDNTRSNRNIMVVGASGSGKTYTFSKPFCYQTAKRRESIVITDPDGGVYRDMAGYFEDRGYIVRRFDLTNLNKSDGWDCMKSITPQNADLDAQMFAQAVISNTVDDLTSIYATGPMSLLKALILRVYLDDTLYPPEKKNIGQVYRLLQNPGGEAFLDTMFDSAIIDADEKLRPCQGPWLSFKQGSPNLRGNLITNLSVQLQLFQNDLVCKVLSTDDIDLTLPAKQPCAYFCLFPDSHDTYRFIVSLFFSMFFTNLINYADQECGGSLPVPVNFLLEEFPSIGHLPDWDRKMATIRKRNLNAVMIFQNITQLQNLYDKTWVTILSNCATMISLGINDGDTADMWTKRIGETSIQVQTEQHPAQEALLAFNHSHSEGEGRRALLSYDELHKIDQDECIILFQGHNPIWAKKYPHILHPDAKTCRTIYPKDIPDIQDIQARTKRKEAEIQRVETWHKLHGPEPTAEERKHMYEGKCESDAEDSMRDKLWDKARERMLQIAQKLDGSVNVEGDSEVKQEVIIESDEEFTLEPELVESSVVDNTKTSASPGSNPTAEETMRDIEDGTGREVGQRGQNGSGEAADELTPGRELEATADIPDLTDEYDGPIPLEDRKSGESNSTSNSGVQTETSSEGNSGENLRKEKPAGSMRQPIDIASGTKKNQMRFNVYQPPQQSTTQKPKAGNVPPGKRKRSDV